MITLQIQDSIDTRPNGQTDGFYRVYHNGELVVSTDDSPHESAGASDMKDFITFLEGKGAIKTEPYVEPEA